MHRDTILETTLRFCDDRTPDVIFEGSDGRFLGDVVWGESGVYLVAFAPMNQLLEWASIPLHFVPAVGEVLAMAAGWLAKSLARGLGKEERDKLRYRCVGDLLPRKGSMFIPWESVQEIGTASFGGLTIRSSAHSITIKGANLPSPDDLRQLFGARMTSLPPEKPRKWYERNLSKSVAWKRT